MKPRICLSGGLIVALMLFFGVAPSAAATHMGVAPGKHIALHFYQNKLYKISPFGKETEFGPVPQGNALVITDVNWQIYGTANKIVDLDLIVANSARSAIALRATVKTDGNGDGGLKQNLTSGLVVGPGMTLFAAAWGATTTSLYLYGYLTPYP